MYNVHLTTAYLKTVSGSSVKDKYVTLESKGEPDPTFQPPSKDTSADLPLLQLKDCLDQFPKAELVKHNCRPRRLHVAIILLKSIEL